MEYSVQAALAQAHDGKIDDWVQSYLRQGPRANLALADGLLGQRRWWVGPIQVPIWEPVRVCGPEPGLEYPVPLAQWDVTTRELADSFTDLESVPPLITEYRFGRLSLRDGNHRLRAFELKGWTTCWVLVWYNTEREFLTDPYPGLDQ